MADALTRNYRVLTPPERFALMVEALARDDQTEADRLEDTDVPRAIARAVVPAWRCSVLARACGYDRRATPYKCPMAAAGASRNEFREWADAYYFGIEDLYEVVKLMVDELEGHRQRVHEGRRPGGN